MRERTTASIIIRHHRSGDVVRLHEIDAHCFPAEISFSRSELLFYLNHPSSVTKVAELDGSIVGFAVGRVEEGWAAHVLTLDVMAEARRQKIGTRLMNALHEEFQQHHAAVSVLEVSTANAGAQRFYEGLHYRYVETLPGYYNGQGDAYRMVRFI